MPMPSHLSDTEIAAFGREVEAIGQKIMEKVGDEDRAYFEKISRIYKWIERSGLFLILASLIFFPGTSLVWSSAITFWVMIAGGAFLLGLAKIIDNMEIGHNLLHGQWNWMKKPQIDSRTWEPNGTCPAKHWKIFHNRDHHHWANVINKDPDIGYSFLRVCRFQKWRPLHIANPISHIIIMLFFEWAVTIFHFLVEKFNRKKPKEITRPKIKQILQKAVPQLLKDYLAYPFIAAAAFYVYLSVFAPENAVFDLSLSAFFSVMLAVFAANVVRNIWASSVIFCGHFPTGVEYFSESEVEGETRAHWYIRQILGSANIEGGDVMHFFSGNLSYQIEHHLFPAMPSNRYKEVAPMVKALTEKYGIRYNSGPLLRQLSSTFFNIWRYTLPIHEELKVPSAPETAQVSSQI